MIQLSIFIRNNNNYDVTLMTNVPMTKNGRRMTVYAASVVYNLHIYENRFFLYLTTAPS